MYSLEIQLLEEVAEILLASTYLTAAAVVVLIYDHILTFPDGKPANSLSCTADSCRNGEVEYVWASPLSVPSIMFFLVSESNFKELLLTSCDCPRTATCPSLSCSLGPSVGISN